MDKFKKSMALKLVNEGLSLEKVADIICVPANDLIEIFEMRRRQKVARQQERDSVRSTRYIVQGSRGGRNPDETMPKGNRVPAWLAAQLRKTHSPDNRSVTARLMGDPLPHQQRWKR